MNVPAANATHPLSPEALERLLEVGKQLARPTELPALLEMIIDAGRDVLAADRGTVFLYDPSARELYVTIGTGIKELRFSIDKGIAGECARHRQVVNVPDCYADPRFNQEVDRATGYRTRCLIAAPLIGFDDKLVGVLQLLNARKGVFDATDERVAVALASQAAVAIQRAMLLDERLIKLKLERDLDLARQIQMAVLPTNIPECPGYDLAGFSKPADMTGGDIYDVISPGDNGEHADPLAPRYLLVADATGHGIGPALSVTQVRAMMRIGLRFNADLDALLTHINAQASADLADNRFVTALIGRLDPAAHRLDYHAAGQAPILFLGGNDNEVQVRDASTIPLGIMADAPNDGLQTLELDPGSVFVLLTDGFFEYQNHRNEQFGVDRVKELVIANRDRSAQEIVNALVAGVQAFGGDAPQLDDLTAVVVKRL